MWLKIENDGAKERIINLELIDVVQLENGKAALWSGGVIVVPDSRMAFDYFDRLPKEQFAKIPEKKSTQQGA